MGEKIKRELEKELKNNWLFKAQLSAIITKVAERSIEKSCFFIDDHFGNWKITIEKR